MKKLAAMKFFFAFLGAFLVSLTSAQFSPNCKGDRQTIVYLFEWRFADVAAECERFLAPKGYCGAQVSPIHESIVDMTPGSQRSWFERYLPVSYKIYTRSGDEAAFIDMVKRCNNVGIRIYVDMVFNHMTPSGFSKGVGVAGTPFDPSTLSFPGVPYTADDFHSNTSIPETCTTVSGVIQDCSDVNQVRNCRFGSFPDINQANPNVQSRILNFMNRLVGIGVAGFRIAYAKYMWPTDLEKIFHSVENLSTQWFPANTRPFIYHEVTATTPDAVKPADYFNVGRVIEPSYGTYVSQAFRGSIHLKEFKTFGEAFRQLMPAKNAFVFIDDPQSQHGYGGSGVIATFWEIRLYKMCVTYMLAWPYGVPQVMSSYRWNRHFMGDYETNTWMGPPADANYNIKPVTIYPNGTCGNDWVCEHRWHQISNMAKFRNVVGSATVQNWWDDGNSQIAFSRGDRGFFVVNGSPSKNLHETLRTGLAEGRYCDVISGDISADKRSCTGATVAVAGDGKATFAIAANAEHPMIAIHLEAKLN